MKLNNKTYLLIKSLPKVGIIKASKILKKLEYSIESKQEFYDTYKKVLLHEKSLVDLSKENLDILYNNTEKLINACDEKGIDIINRDSNYYPENFKKIKNAPIFLFSKGNKNILNNNKYCAVIGSREPTEYGLKISYKISELLSNNNVIIVSGLALGCDTQAHLACVNNKKPTIAIMPSGLDNILPKQNIALAEDILNHQGCLISEYPINTQVRKFNYVDRDRLQSAISNSVILVESKIDGGSMHTVKFAENYNVKVYCWQHNEKYLDTNKASGNIHLLKKESITAVKSSQDIKDFFLN